MNYDEIKSTLLLALEKAGQILANSLDERRVIAKKTELSIVTATDQLAEEAIIQTIRSKFPDHAILAEESLASGQSPYRWIIDPLDGTTNFAHTYPVACVSIAYEEKGVIRFGGVFDPFRKELFFAEKGKGATLNGKPIHVSAIATLNDALLATGFPYDRRQRIDAYLAILKDFLLLIQGIRRTGSAATDICYVACGRFDGYWECNLNPWDVAAAWLICEEAGGKVSNFSGETYQVDSRQTFASNGHLHPFMLKVLEPHRHL